MTDVVDPAKRSQMMAGIRGKNTRPELLIRGMLHTAGFRYRLHRRDLPGSPDLVLPKYNAAILVHGCFWHAHAGCKFFKIPSSNSDFWVYKLVRNRERDREQIKALLSLGWRVLVVWECATRVPEHRKILLRQLVAWIRGTDSFGELPPTQPGPV